MTQDAAPTRERLGYIGLGNMGAAMAANLADRGWRPVVYARRAASLEPLEGLALQIVNSPAAVAAECDILCLCPVDTAQIRDILFGPEGAAGALAPGSLVVVHSTISPSDCVDLAEELGERQIGLVDAPVSGGATRGRAGTLTIGVAGTEADVARCIALLSDGASTLIRVGAVGNGQRAKLLNNAVMLAQLALVHDMVETAAACGISASAQLRFTTTGTGASWAASYYLDAVEAGRKLLSTGSVYPGGAVAIMRKDANLFLQETEATGRPLLRNVVDGALAALLPMLPTMTDPAHIAPVLTGK
ncbi:NAD(P)-dependent oxidoreductase [Sphingopyxis sp.]|uniref:NAD(P)-dependent oxidoreductase n=1 Tax=Sphingopyxis sp. TaxID=1908224 RepID=UPI003BADBBBA